MEAFNILLPLHHTWLDLVFSGEKPFEFRNKIESLGNRQPAFLL